VCALLPTRFFYRPPLCCPSAVFCARAWHQALRCLPLCVKQNKPRCVCLSLTRAHAAPGAVHNHFWIGWILKCAAMRLNTKHLRSWTR
jgi:hypothetical protein